MKRAFDANVSRARPRTRTATTEVAAQEKEQGLSADLAAVLVGPRAGRGDLRRARAAAAAAGEVASQVAKDEPHVSRGRDSLAQKEEQLALRAGEIALGAARAQARATDESSHKQRLAQAMRNAAARVAEAAADASGGRHATQQVEAGRQGSATAGGFRVGEARSAGLDGRQPLQPPAWVVKAALPQDDVGQLELPRSEKASGPVTGTRGEAAMNESNPGAGSGTPAGERPAARSAEPTGTGRAREPGSVAAVAPQRSGSRVTVIEHAPAAVQGAPVQAREMAAPMARDAMKQAESTRQTGSVGSKQAMESAGAVASAVAGHAESVAPGASIVATQAGAAASVVATQEEPAGQGASVVVTSEGPSAPSVAVAPDVAAGPGPNRPRVAPPAEDTVLQGRARIAELRGRLAATTRPRVTAAEVVPSDATAVVRQAVDELRARLMSALADRDTLARSLESTRDELAQAHKDLHARSVALEEARALARERAGVAEELAAEAEALAEERDQALARILDLKALDEQQTALLTEAEEALAERDRLLVEAEGELQELASLLDLRAAEAEELSSALEEKTRERDLLAARVKELEAEVQRLSGTREALAEIQRLVSGTTKGAW